MYVNSTRCIISKTEPKLLLHLSFLSSNFCNTFIPATAWRCIAYTVCTLFEKFLERSRANRISRVDDAWPVRQVASFIWIIHTFENPSQFNKKPAYVPEIFESIIRTESASLGKDLKALHSQSRIYGENTKFKTNVKLYDFLGFLAFL